MTSQKPKEIINLNFNFASLDQIREIQIHSNDKKNSFSIDFHDIQSVEYVENSVLILELANGVLRMDLDIKRAEELINIIKKSQNGV